MTLEIVLPFGKRKGIKNLVFTILSKESPLKLIELTNFIKKRYGISVTFQAVRKAVLELVDEKVLIQEWNEFSINKMWVTTTKKAIDTLYNDLYKEKITPKSLDSIGGDVSVFTFNSLNELMKFWQDLIDDWFNKFKRGNPNINVYQAAHVWETLLHPDVERKIMEQLKKKGIIAYALITSNTPLDRYIRKFYRSIGIKTHIRPSSSSFDRGYYVGTYGELIVQAQYPKKLVKLLDEFFKKNTSIEKLNIKELSDIVNKKIKIKLTVIKNLEMAKQINKSVISQI